MIKNIKEIDIFQEFLRSNSMKAFVNTNGELNFCSKSALSMLDDEHRITINNFGELHNKKWKIKNYSDVMQHIVELNQN